MLKEPLHTLNSYKWKADRHLATKEGYQWYDIDFRHNRLVPIKNGKLYFKAKLVDPLIESYAKGHTVIDMGCDKGYFSWKAMNSGATRVVANDINTNLYSYLTILVATMKWHVIEPVNKDMFPEELVENFDYVFSFAMLHEVRSVDIQTAVQKIRSMCRKGAIIEFCEDYMQKFGEQWNRKWFEGILSCSFSDFLIANRYDAIGGPPGKRYIYDCRCH